MPIIIDTCTFPQILKFNEETSDSFKAVHKWIFESNGLITYGGSKYKAELQLAKSYLSIIIELEKKRKVIKLNDDEVDSLYPIIKEKGNCTDFDDEHLVAIAIISGSTVICTEDRRAEKFLKNKIFYSKRPAPKIIKKTTPVRSTQTLLKKTQA
ncbi:hypothetical protein [Legionella pneumophila]|uniref:hypothetical protein n=1 Tax=Legionella pneumophila TaxID=446 RepID=UPI00277C9015|nr:hypothetical protein [Legionella pneumophila]